MPELNPIGSMVTVIAGGSIVDEVMSVEKPISGTNEAANVTSSGRIA